MANTKDSKAVHPDIPTSRAWQAGRRIYVRCAYGSSLAEALLKLGSHWDSEQRARWVGTTKRAEVVDLLLAVENRKKAAEEIKKAGHWVRIPYQAGKIRARVKQLGGVYDGDLKSWAMPSAEARTEILQLVRDWQAMWDAEEQAAIEASRRQAEEHARRQREAAEAAAARRKEQLVADSGRKPTGETETLLVVSTRRMNRRQALQMAHPLGTTVRLPDGRRGLVTGVKVRFTDEEAASSVCWHPETHDQAHWDIEHELVIVEPTEEERAADQQRAAERKDAQELHALVSDARELTYPRAEDRWTHVPDQDRIGTITVTTGTVTDVPDGKLILTTDGSVIWQHPGYYDDYTRSEGVSTDPDLVARVRRLLAAGPRTRVVEGQMPITYRIEVTGDA